MRIVESKLFDENANSDFEQHPVEGWEFSNIWHAAELHRVEGSNREWNSNEDLIEDDGHDDPDQPPCVDGLVRAGLDFVFSKESRLVCEIHDCVDGTEDPVDHESVAGCPVNHQIELIVT